MYICGAGRQPRHRCRLRERRRWTVERRRRRRRQTDGGRRIRGLCSVVQEPIQMSPVLSVSVGARCTPRLPPAPATTAAAVSACRRQHRACADTRVCLSPCLAPCPARNSANENTACTLLPHYSLPRYSLRPPSRAVASVSSPAASSSTVVAIDATSATAAARPAVASAASCRCTDAPARQFS